MSLCTASYTCLNANVLYAVLRDSLSFGTLAVVCFGIVVFGFSNEMSSTFWIRALTYSLCHAEVKSRIAPPVAGRQPDADDIVSAGQRASAALWATGLCSSAVAVFTTIMTCGSRDKL